MSKELGKHDLYGSGLLGPVGGSVYFDGQQTGSVGCFQWVAGAHGRCRLKRGKVKVRVSGNITVADDICTKAREICDLLDKGEYHGPKNVRVKGMKKLTLNQTWTKTMPMWRWIGEEIKVDSPLAGNNLKGEWFDKNDPESRNCRFGCYFCQYSSDHMEPEQWCSQCPARLVSPKLHAYWCEENQWDWNKKPLAFLAKLEALNKKRLARMLS
jgi:hypothetical protein